MNETTTPRTKTSAAKPSGFRPCRCQQYFIANEVEIDGSPDFANEQTTECTRNVAGKTDFAPGHDAKLKSLLINAKRTGRSVFRLQGGVQIHHTPESAAAEYGFSYMVANAKPAKAPADRKAKAAKAEQPSTVAIKVGRWTYQATINTETGRATYTAKDGSTKSTSSFKLA